MKFISWNVNGLRACVNKGFKEFFMEQNADIFAIQETKMQPDQLEIEFDGYYKYMYSAEKKGYSGTAIFTKKKPISITYDIEGDDHPNEGRVITAEYEDYYFVTAYVPNSKEELKRLEYRCYWEKDLLKHLINLDKIKPVIYCGDLNVAHNDIDLKNPKTNHFNPGFSDQERECFNKLLDSGFKDTFRELYPDTQTFSWWSYRFNSREKNTGWRIDYFVVSNRLMNRVKDSVIHIEQYGSDHCPVSIVLE